MAKATLIPDPLDMAEDTATGRKGKKASKQVSAPAPAPAKGKTKGKAAAAPQAEAPKAKGKAAPAPKVKADGKTGGAPRFGRRAGQPAASEFIRAYFLKGGTVEDCYAQIKKQMGKDTVRLGHVTGILKGCKRNGWGYKEAGDKIKIAKPSK